MKRGFRPVGHSTSSRIVLVELLSQGAFVSFLGLSIGFKSLGDGCSGYEGRAEEVGGQGLDLAFGLHFLP